MIRRLKGKEIFFVFRCLLSTACCLLILTACGKKGDPTLKSYEKPEAPAGLKAIHREDEIILFWEFPREKEQGIKAFHIMKSSDGDFQKVALLERDKRFYADKAFSIGKKYYYKIISENLRGIMNDSVIFSLEPLPPPQPPGNLRFEVAYNTITITWGKPDETYYYNIYKSSQKGQYTLTPLNSQPLTNTYFKDSFDINQSVFYTVRSSTGSSIRDEGPPSEELAVNPLEFIPSSPQNLTAVPTPDEIYLVWHEPSETWVTGYRVYREIQKQEGYILIGFTQTPSFIDREKITASRNYRVAALGPSKEGPPAEIRDVAYKPPR